jgi:hypothetical protein
VLGAAVLPHRLVPGAAAVRHRCPAATVARRRRHRALLLALRARRPHPEGRPLDDRVAVLGDDPVAGGVRALQPRLEPDGQPLLAAARMERAAAVHPAPRAVNYLEPHELRVDLLVEDEQDRARGALEDLARLRRGLEQLRVTQGRGGEHGAAEQRRHEREDQLPRGASESFPHAAPTRVRPLSASKP